MEAEPCKNTKRRRQTSSLLLHHMEDHNLRRGIASLCIGGGMGIAMAIELTN
nr:hypothetical protein [Prosthecobacter vanneervenii]